MTLTLELPDDLAARLTAAYPNEAERSRAVLHSIVEAIEAEQRDKAEWIEIINTRLDALESGGKAYSLDEAWERLDAMQAERLTAANR